MHDISLLKEANCMTISMALGQEKPASASLFTHIVKQCKYLYVNIIGFFCMYIQKLAHQFSPFRYNLPNVIMLSELTL